MYYLFFYHSCQKINNSYTDKKWKKETYICKVLNLSSDFWYFARSNTTKAFLRNFPFYKQVILTSDH